MPHSTENPESKIGDQKTASAFVTGGTGFIGSHLVEELKRRGYGEIRCLVRSEPRWLEGMDVVPVYGEIEDSPALRDGLMDVDYVFHVGGVTRAREWREFERANVEAPLLLLDLVQEVNPSVRKVVMTSSLAAVGACDETIATEDTPLDPISDYGRSKRRMEWALHQKMKDSTTPPVVIIRPPAVYGPREADIYTFFQSASRRLVPIVGSGREPAVTLVHVRDLVKGMVDAAESEATAGQTYFLGSPRPYSWVEVKEATTKALGKRAVTVRVPEPLVGVVGAISELGGRITGSYPPLNREKAREIRYACKMCSSEQARLAFGYQPEVDLVSGIAETVQWYRDNGWL